MCIPLPEQGRLQYRTVPGGEIAFTFNSLHSGQNAFCRPYGTSARDRIDASSRILRPPITDAGRLVVALGHDHTAVHSQMAKILESPHFRNSKRSGSLLRFVVEATVAGDRSFLKERCIGAAVFGRETAYDTAQDPIVRNAAIEVRKRLAQYYMDPEHAGELRIELPSGSYMPTFTVEAPVAEPLKPLAEPEKPSEEAESSLTARRSHPLRWALAGVILAALCATVALLWIARRTPVSELEAFWEPLFRDRSTIQICIGQPTRLYRFTGQRTEELNRVLAGPASPDRNRRDLSIAADELAWVAPDYLFSRDALSAFKVASWVQSKGRAYQLMSVSQTNYSRLRHAPLVAIGAFNNSWAMRVTSELRFVFDHRTIDGISYNCINDQRDPKAVNWMVKQPGAGAMTEDYAIVTRVFDPSTEKTVVSVAGIEAYGTLAAGEFVTEPEYAGVALSAAPRGWRHKNVQFVLTTKIIDGTPGPPRVLATHVW